MNKETELKPCPFCGEEAESWEDDGILDGLRVGCIDESCPGSFQPDGIHIEQWNTRADKARYLQMAVEAVEETKKTAIKADSVFYLNAATEAIKQRFEEEA